MRDLGVALRCRGVAVAMPYRKHSEALEIILSQIWACEEEIRRAMTKFVRRDLSLGLPGLLGPLAHTLNKLFNALGGIGLPM